MKLYWSAEHPDRWISFSKAEGWMQFPAKEGGWSQRTGIDHLNPDVMEPLPAYRAFGTGFPGSEELYRRREAA